MLAGRPRQGPLFEHKKHANALYKYAVRFICKNEQAMRADSMAKKVISNNATDFWKEVKVLNNCRMPPPCTIDGISGVDNIAELWRQQNSTLFNCVQSDIYVPVSVECVDSKVFFSHEASHTINKLTDNKASGLDHITAGHIKYASMRLALLLAICFNAFFKFMVSCRIQ